MKYFKDFAEGLLSATRNSDTEKARAILTEIKNRFPDGGLRNALFYVDDFLKFTAIHFAADNGNIDLIKLFIDNGAKVNLGTFPGNGTPLHIAAEHGHVEIGRLLLENGAIIDSQNEFRLTPLHLAVMRYHEEMVAFLVSQGANRELKHSEGRNAIEIAEHMVKKWDPSQQTGPYFDICKEKYEKALKLLNLLSLFVEPAPNWEETVPLVVASYPLQSSPIHQANQQQIKENRMSADGLEVSGAGMTISKSSR
jgi:hypothetical protein